MIASCTLEEARDKIYLDGIRQSSLIFQSTLSCFGQISPALDESSQLQYLKKTKELGLVASIVRMTVAIPSVSSSIRIIHHRTDMSLQYPNLFERKTASPEKKPFGNVSLLRKTNGRNISALLVLNCFILKGSQYFSAEVEFLSA